MSADDYDSWQETVYLLRSPENAKRLMEAVARPAPSGPFRERVEGTEHLTRAPGAGAVRCGAVSELEISKRFSSRSATR